MEHKTRTKALSWLLSFALMLSLIPTMSIPARAAVALDENSTIWREDSTITDDTVTIDGGVTIEADMKLTIPAGKTLTVNGGINAEGKTLTVNGGGTLIVNGTNGANGTDRSNAAGDNGCDGGNGITGNLIVDGATVTVTGGNGGNGGSVTRGKYDGGNGGAGGNGVTGTVTVSAGVATITGGSGGDGGTTTNGKCGNGGMAGNGVTGAVIVNAGSVTITGGNGGNGGVQSGAGSGNGGTGGNGVGAAVSVTAGFADITGGNGGTCGLNGTAGTAGAAVTGTLTGKAEDSADKSTWAEVASGGTSTKQYVKVRSLHTHTFTFGEPAGDTITATCTNTESECPLTDHKATLKIAPSSSGGSMAEFAGDAKEFDLSGVTISYKQKTDATTWSPVEDSVVQNAPSGFFEASAEVAGDKTISVRYGFNAIHKGTATGGVEKCDFTVPAVATVGAAIEPTVMLDKGYEAKSITVKNHTTQADISTEQQATAKTFVMPDFEVTVDMAFGKANYTIGGLNAIQHGAIAASKGESPVSAENPAQYEDEITLTATPDKGYAFQTVAVKDVAGQAVAVSGEGDARTFTMPASNVTVTATFVPLPFPLTSASDPNGAGKVEFSGSDVVKNGDKTTAKTGTEVTLTPVAAAGYVFDDRITAATTEGNEAVTVTDGKMTMAPEAVTVTAAFAKKNVPVELALAGNDQTACTASLLGADFAEITDPLSLKADERFILRVSYDEGCDYSIALNEIETANLKDYITIFSAEEYAAYVTYIQEHDLSIPSNTDLFWIKMPYVAEEKLTVTVTFAAEKSFTILYQTTEEPEEMWCRFTATDHGTTGDVTVDMNRDATIGGAAVWSAKVVAAFDPTHVAFAATEEGAASADSTECEVKTSTADGNWTNYAETGKFVVIGGAAKTVIAAFVSDVSAMSYYNVDTAEFEPGTGNGVEYVIGVMNDGTATVTAPAAPAKTDYEFLGWRGIVNKEEVTYDGGATNVAIKESTLFSAVWKHRDLSVKLNLNGGQIGTNITTIAYENTLKELGIQTPTRNGFAFEGWVADKTVTEDETLFMKGAPFDTETKITNDLELSAKWKHIHDYKYYELSAYGVSGDGTMLHVAKCGCGDYKLMAHDFNSKGVCACGYRKGESLTKTVTVRYGEWKNNDFVQLMDRSYQCAKYQTVLEIAPDASPLRFEKWQYSEDGGATWQDFSYSAWTGFRIVADVDHPQFRALYVNAAKTAKVELTSKRYRANANSPATIEFNMNFQLPSNYTFVDAGIRLGDNEGISYYEIKEKKWSASKSAAYGATAIGLAFLSGGGLFDAIMGTAEKANAVQTYYEKRWDNVLDKQMTPQGLAKYMYEHKPVNVEKYPPIYMEARFPVKTSSGSMSTLCSVGIAQENGGKNYIYGIAYLRYKDNTGKTKTIYTDAFAVNLLNPNGSRSQVGN